jgi:hypothetical protein
MCVWECLLVACLAAPQVDVTVTPLQGAEVSGKLLDLTDQRVQLQTAEGVRQFEAAAVQSARTSALPVVPQITDGSVTVGLVDGSLLAANDFRVQQGQAQIELLGGGKITVPTRGVRWARFGKPDAAVQEQWQAILHATTSADRVVVRKVTTGGGVEGDGTIAAALDDLPGVLADVGAEVVDFEFDGSKLQVPRKKVEGVVYFHPPVALPPAVGRLTDSAGSTWALKSLRLEAGIVNLVTNGDVQHALPLNQWTRIDFSAGNLVFISDLQPESVQWQPYVESPAMSPTLAKWFQPRWNTSVYGGPLMLGGQSYERGLVLHSRTLMAFRLNDDFQHFLATVGVDDRFRSTGSVRLAVLGEKGTLFEQLIRGRDEPLDLDIDVRGVRRLQILVDFGDDRSDAGDHLNLCNARLIK